MSAALRDSPNLKAAAARLRQAQALARVEGARLLPFLDAQAGVETSRISSDGFNVALRGAHLVSGFIYPLNLRYSFDFWGKNRALLQAALGVEAAEAAETAQARLQLTAAIAKTYFRGAALRGQLALAEEMAALRSESLRLAETRLRLGLDSALPAQHAEADREAAVKTLADLRNRLELQRNLLARLIGRGPDATREAFAAVPDMPVKLPLPVRLPLELLAHRPDLAAALNRAEAAAQRVKAAKAGFLPSVDLTAFVGLSALRMTKGAGALANILFSGSSLSYGVAPGVRLPLFEGGRLRGELSAQRAEYDEAVELYNRTLLEAVQEVADSLSAWRETRDAVEAQSRLLAARRQAVEIAQARLLGGLDDRRALLAQRHALLSQEFELRALEAQRLLAAADLMEALGGGYAGGPGAAAVDEAEP